MILNSQHLGQQPNFNQIIGNTDSQGGAQRYRASFGQTTSRRSARPHSVSADFSAVTAASSNSSGARGNSGVRRNTSMRLVAKPNAREFAPIKVISDNSSEFVNFKHLLETCPENYRKDRLLVKRIKKIFADGISIEDVMEQAQVRKDAYCLSLGLSARFLEEYTRPIYQNLLKVSSERNEKHKLRMEAFKEQNGPNARLPLDSCCDDET